MLGSLFIRDSIASMPLDVFPLCFVSYPAQTALALCIGDEVKSTQCAEAFTIKFYGLTWIIADEAQLLKKISFKFEKKVPTSVFLLNKN